MIDDAWQGSVQFWELLFGTWLVYIFLVLLWEKLLRQPLEEWRYVLLVFLARAGMVAAKEHAQHLPDFKSQSDAERVLFARRDELLNTLQQAATQSSEFRFDLSPDSLKGLEKWYFNLLESDGFQNLGLSRETFEQCISMYLGQVVVQNHPEFSWVVDEYPFQKGKYEIGVRRRLFTWMLTGRMDLAARRNNKRRQSLWREYRDRLGSQPA